MRTTLRTRLLLTVSGSALLAAGFVIACGSSDSSDTTETPDAAEASVPDTFVPKPDTGAPDTGTPDTGPVYDAGAPVILDGGGLVDGGIAIACVVGGRLEEESNDNELLANPLETDGGSPPFTRCGVIVSSADAGSDAGDGGTLAENDYLTFTLGNSTQSFYLQFAGEVSLELKVDGSAPVTINKTSSPNLPFVRNQPYFIRIYSNDGTQQTWRVSLFEN